MNYGVRYVNNLFKVLSRCEKKTFLSFITPEITNVKMKNSILTTIKKPQRTFSNIPCGLH